MFGINGYKILKCFRKEQRGIYFCNRWCNYLSRKIHLIKSKHSIETNFNIEIFEKGIPLSGRLVVVFIVITIFQEDNIFGMNASLTYGPHLSAILILSQD